MRTIFDNQQEFNSIISLKNELINFPFDGFPKQLFKRNIISVLPTVLSFHGKNYQDAFAFAQHIAHFFQEPEFFILPVHSDFDIVGKFSEASVSYESGKSFLAGRTIEHYLIGAIAQNDAFEEIGSLLSYPQFQDVLNRGYFLFGHSKQWAFLDSEDLDLTCLFLFTHERTLLFEQLDVKYKVDIDYVLENYIYNFGNDNIKEFEHNYVSKMVNTL